MQRSFLVGCWLLVGCAADPGDTKVITYDAAPRAGGALSPDTRLPSDRAGGSKVTYGGARSGGAIGSGGSASGGSRSGGSASGGSVAVEPSPDSGVAPDTRPDAPTLDTSTAEVPAVTPDSGTPDTLGPLDPRVDYERWLKARSLCKDNASATDIIGPPRVYEPSCVKGGIACDKMPKTATYDPMGTGCYDWPYKEGTSNFMGSFCKKLAPEPHPECCDLWKRACLPYQKCVSIKFDYEAGPGDWREGTARECVDL